MDGWVELDNLDPDSTCRAWFTLMYNMGLVGRCTLHTLLSASHLSFWVEFAMLRFSASETLGFLLTLLSVVEWT